jgi:hypothetical protein
MYSGEPTAILVEHLHEPLASEVGRQVQVLGLEVPVHDPHRVGLADSVAGLHDVVARHADGQRAVALEDRREVHARQVLHDHEGLARR